MGGPRPTAAPDPRLPAARAPPEPRRAARDPARDRRPRRADTRGRARVRRHAGIRPRRPAAVGELAGERPARRADRERAAPGPECGRRPLPRQLRRGPERRRGRGRDARAGRASRGDARRSPPRAPRPGRARHLRRHPPLAGAGLRPRAALPPHRRPARDGRRVQLRLEGRQRDPGTHAAAEGARARRDAVARRALDRRPPRPPRPRARPRRDRGVARGARGAGAGLDALAFRLGCCSARRSALASSAPASRSHAGRRRWHSMRAWRG